MKRKNMTKFDKAVSAAFTGHRFYNFSQQEVIRERLTKAILEAYEHGISNFISGFAIGIDLMAAQIVQSLKPFCPGMTLTAAIPFRGQADRFKPGDRIVYDELIASADEVIILSEYYYTRCFLDRDEFMVENASLLIAFYDGREKGGNLLHFQESQLFGHSGGKYILNNSPNIKFMNEFVDIIVIYIVFRAILAFLGAWWHGDGRNDFRRDR